MASLTDPSTPELHSPPVAASQSVNNHTRVKKFDWQYLGKRLLYPIWICILIYSIAFLNNWSFNVGQNHFSACTNDGTFTQFFDSYDRWSIQGFFQITVHMGSLSFRQAKAIDLVWNLVVGHGGQAVLAYFTWRATAYIVATSMETRSVTYESFSAIFITQESSFTNTYRLIVDKSIYRALRTKCLAAFILLSFAFVAFFPTFANGLAGYATKAEAFIPDYGKLGSESTNYIKFSEFDLVRYIIHDGWRINKTGNFIMGYGENTENVWNITPDPLLSPSPYPEYDSSNASYANTPCRPSDDECRETYTQIILYVAEYGLHGMSKTQSAWRGVTLPPPSLNISSFQNSYWHPNNASIIYVYSNKTYPFTYIQDTGLCQSVANTYYWGFSYMQLMLVLKIPKGLRSCLYLSSAIQRDFATASINPSQIRDQELKQTVAERFRGGKVSFKPALITSERSLKQFLWKYIKSHKWWVLILVAHSCSTSYVLYARRNYNFWLYSLMSFVSLLFAVISLLLEVSSRWIFLYIPVAVGLNYFSVGYLEQRCLYMRGICWS
ncbi:hypothetical protein QBC43DRAFT_324231 [Cladorrhinum sp. PSN259]|nr:hypothetical protein QBC43DRAFT_324231 [Cladorrhinum sp. PSN259]